MSKGFYRVYERIFQEIAAEELKSGEHSEDEATEPPAFGLLLSTLLIAGNASSSYDDVVRPFYAFWENFVTTRQFHSSDKWDVREVFPF